MPTLTALNMHSPNMHTLTVCIACNMHTLGQSPHSPPLTIYTTTVLHAYIIIPLTVVYRMYIHPYSPP